MDNIELESLSERAFEALEAVGGDINRPSEPARTVVIVYSAQGIIDNGGLPYFFYSDFPGSPRYSVFSAAYLRIGAADAAEAIALAAKLFPFPEAHVQETERRTFLEGGSCESQLMALSDKICGNEHIWQLLSQYAHAHAAELGAA